VRQVWHTLRCLSARIDTHSDLFALGSLQCSEPHFVTLFGKHSVSYHLLPPNQRACHLLAPRIEVRAQPVHLIVLEIDAYLFCPNAFAVLRIQRRRPQFQKGH
jgi:hypothetical protein